MKWIKYKIICNETDNVLINKRIGYSEANLAIAQAEAYNGAYQIEEDDKNLPDPILPVDRGGTGAVTPEAARQNLGAGDMNKSVYDADGDGVVDNAEKVNGHTVNADVPEDAKFSDTVYTHPKHKQFVSGLYKITVDAQGHITGATLVQKSDITNLGIPGSQPDVPTRTSQLTNDSGFLTRHQDISGKLDKTGGTMTGALVAQNNANYTTKQVRNIFLIADGSSLPSGANGDICLVYTP